MFQVYSALSEIADKVAKMEESSQLQNTTRANATSELLLTQDCKSRLVCQTYHEFNELLDVTKGAATLLRWVNV